MSTGDTKTVVDRVAVFDLDVTLTRYDTYLPFLVGYVRRNPARWAHVGRLPFSLAAFWRWGERTWVKNCFLRAFVGGVSRTQLTDWGEHFARGIYENAMRDRGLERLRAHQEDGDRVILASASFGIYVEPLARLLGIDEVLASRVSWDNRDRLAGMDGENCRDEEKLRRVRSLLPDRDDGRHVTAYSDSHADLPLLKWAEVGVAVCPSKRLTHQVQGLELEVADW
jgi:HAD superfamily hydrolase (TIGR01490 family)